MRRKRDPAAAAAAAATYRDLARYQLRLALDPHMAPEAEREERRRVSESLETASVVEMRAIAERFGAGSALANLDRAAEAEKEKR